MTTVDPGTAHFAHPNYVGPPHRGPRDAAPQFGAPQVGGGLGVPGQAFAGPVPPPPVPAPSVRSPRRPVAAKLVAGLVAAGLLVGGAGAWYSLSGPSSAYEPLASAGANPFTAPVGTDNLTVQPVAHASGLQPGDTPALFAADPAHPSCDPAALISALHADPGKATAWAGVLGTTADQILSAEVLVALSLQNPGASQ